MEKHIDKYGYEYGTSKQWRAVEYIEYWLSHENKVYTGDCYPDLLHFLDKHLKRAKRTEMSFLMDCVDWTDMY